MRRLLRLALPLGLLAALAVPTSALAQVTVSTNNLGGLALLASSPTNVDNTAFTGTTTAGSSTVTALSTDPRSFGFGDIITGAGIAGGPLNIVSATQAGGATIANGGAVTSGSVVTVTTTTPHGFVAGQVVTISGNSQANNNGSFKILTVPSATTFTYGAVNLGTGTGNNGTAAGPATITTATPHNLAPGSIVAIEGAATTGYNGTYVVNSTPSATTFTYTGLTSALAASGAGGTATSDVQVAGIGTPATLTADPVGTDNTLKWSANSLPNSAGNAITLAYNDPGGGNATLGVSVVGNAITINLGRASVGTIAASPGGATEVGNTVTITTTTPHGLEVGRNVTIAGVGVAGYNGTFAVVSVPTATTFTYTNPTAGLAGSGAGTVTTVTTTAAQVAASANINSGIWAPVNALVTMKIVNGASTDFGNGRLAAMPATALSGGADDLSLQLNQPAGASAAAANLQSSAPRRNGDMAFWGNTLVQGDSHGMRVFDISNPASPQLKSDFACSGMSGDVSIWGNLVFRSVDVPQSTDTCSNSRDQLWRTTGGDHSLQLASSTGALVTPSPIIQSAAQQSTKIGAGFEGVRIIDIADPTNPVFIKGVATDCGSFSHTVVPDPANNRVLLYVSSFPNAGLDATPTTYGNTCEQTGAGHDKLTIVQVPLAAPATASVLAEIPLGLKGYNSFFAHIPGYTGDYNNTPGYKGCHDITVNMATHTAAAACVTEGVSLDITNPAAPTVQDHFVNPDIDLCATGVYRWGGGTQATTPNCMWASAMFTYDGSKIIWSNLASGHSGCINQTIGAATSTTGAGGQGLSCNQRGNVNASVDRFYDGQSLSNECETGSGTAPVRSPLNRGAIWMYNADDPSWPISQFKIPFDETDSGIDRYEPQSNQGCSSALGNVVPVNGKYIVPMSWHTGGMDVIDWSDSATPTELGWFDVDTTDSSSALISGTPATRDAGNSPLRSNAAAAYWYNGYVYVSYDAPAYGSWAPTGSRGLEVFQLNDPSVAGAFDLPHLNPQTMEGSFTCAITISGSPKVGAKRTIKATVKVNGQPVTGAVVKGSTKGFNGTKTTPANGQVSFSVKPKKGSKTLTFSVAGQLNMAGCSKSKNVAK